MGRVKKGTHCSVRGCEAHAVKSVSLKDFKSVDTGLDVEAEGRRVYLCKEHYKIYKKLAKKVKRLERWRWA